jgi:hypothetical protein
MGCDRVKMFFRIVLLSVFGFMPFTQVFSATYSDSFDNLNFWNITQQQYGSVSISSAQAHSGNNSLMLSSVDGGQRWISATRSFDTLGKGKASIWFYDTAPGEERLYSSFVLRNSTVSNNTMGYDFSIGVTDSNANWYEAGTQFENASSMTSVARTSGWHNFEIELAQGFANFYIDGAKVHSTAGDFQFDKVKLQEFGPGWRPNMNAYFDDFSAITAPEPLSCALFILGGGALFGRRIRRFKK